MDIYEEVCAFYESVKTEKTIIGNSFFGRNIYAIKLGYGAPVGIAQYAIHGREFITAKLAFSQYFFGQIIGSFWLIPLVNPDGALLSQIGIDSVRDKEDKESLLSLNYDSADFSLWKANGRGVDLNVNFPAEWGKGVKNVGEAGAENYIGKTPFSERETLALGKFTTKIRPDYTLSYHTKGEELYWRFFQDQSDEKRDRRLAEILSVSTGYPIRETQGSVGGYKDWCIRRFKIPAFTIETGKDEFSHPIQDDKALKDIIEKNEKSLCDLSREYLRLL